MALNTTLQTVANLDQKVPFADKTPTTLVWVSATALSSGDGSRENPFNSIQAGVDAAQAGTAIMVRAGTYQENVKLPSGNAGTANAPIWLVSADGPQAAKIVAADQTKSTISGLGTDNFVINGFEIEGGSRGIQFSQSGSNFTNMTSNIVITNNHISNTADDGIKISQGQNFYIENNRTQNTGGEGIDLLATNNSVVTKNEVSEAQGAAGIFAKGGSTNVLMSDNYVHDVAKDGIIIGGWTEDQFFRPGFSGYEAKNVIVRSNVIENVGSRPINVLGAQTSAAYGNYLEANPTYPTVIHVGSGYPRASQIAYSSDIDVFENFISRGTKLFSVSAGNSNNVDFYDNVLNQATSPISLKISSGTDLTIFQTAPDLLSTIPLDVTTSSTSYILNSRQTDLTYTGSKQFRGTGNDKANVITGGSGNDVLDGKAGADKLIGGAGSDRYYVDNINDVVVETLNSGQDSIETTLNVYTLPTNVEILKFTGSISFHGIGNDSANNISGGSGDDIIDGKGGADKLAGGAGNDTYIIDDRGDVIVELALDGLDTVKTSLNEYTLSRFVENLTYSGTSKFIGIGNDQDNIITGSSGDDVIDGRGGSDTLIGSFGNDTYLVESGSDKIIELQNGGIDTVFSKTTYSLNDNIENLTLSGTSAIAAYGNSIANVIKGNDAANKIDGAGGADILTGGRGNDSFIFKKGQANGDKISDFSGAGLGLGDTLVFVGYGSGTIKQVGKSDYYTITPDEAHGGSAAAETIQLIGVYNLDLLSGAGHNDYSFMI